MKKCAILRAPHRMSPSNTERRKMERGLVRGRSSESHPSEGMARMSHFYCKEQYDTNNSGSNRALRKLLVLIATILLPVFIEAAEPQPLTTLAAIRALSNQEAGNALPVAFEATVIYSRGYAWILFVQDGNDALYVSADTTNPWQ